MDIIVRGVADIAIAGIEHFARSEVIQRAVATAIVVVASGAVACGLMVCSKWDPNPRPATA